MSDPYALMAGFYDDWSAHMEGDISFYVEQASRSGGTVVELGAGNGRVSIPIALAGVPVVAVEPSAPMRDDGMRKAAEAGAASITWVDADMRTYVADPPVPLVIIPFRSFQHLLTTQDQMQALASIRSSLQPEGRLIFNVFTVDPRHVAAQDDVRSLRFTFTDGEGRRHETYATPRNTLATQRLDVTVEHLTFEGDNLLRAEEAVLRLRNLYRYEAEHLLARCGFEIEALYGDFDGREYGPGPDEMIWIARRT